VNINVPNKDVSDIKGWRAGRIGHEPPRRMSTATLEPKVGHDGSYYVRMQWGDAVELPADTDGGLVENDYVSVSYLTAIGHHERDEARAAESALTALFDR
jgi:broad specificity polyphosphatase/5'/3'-nucleotidase SurE